VSSKLPQVSGLSVVKLLKRLDYEIIHQRGSHIQLRKVTDSGEHHITVPAHKTIAKGTLNDILSKVSLWNNISKEKLIDSL
jgi:predicted RNA binding protein YcfA (HicA-like mRNA interferase family)